MAIQYQHNLIRALTDRVMRWLILRDRAPAYYYLLTVEGRKTGLPRSRPVALVENGDRKWLVAPYGVVNWVLNARAAGQVTLTRGDNQEIYSIQELPVEDRARVLKQYITSFPITRPYFDARYTDPPAAFLQGARERPVFILSRKSGE